MIRYGLLALTAVFFASCAVGTLVDSPTGSVSFAFPQGTSSRSITDTYKVVIYYGLDRYDVEPAVSGNELTFTDIPTGDVRIIVAEGQMGSDGYFYTEKYGQLYITIVAGDNGPYNLDLDESEFVSVPSLSGKNVNGLAALDGTFYASTVSSLAAGTYSDGSFAMVESVHVPAVPDGVAVSSVSIGEVYDDGVLTEQVWVNGSWTWDATAEEGAGGIMPWLPGTPGTLDTDFSSGFGNSENRKDGAITDVDVAYAESFDVPGEDGLAILFKRDGGMGGVYLQADEFDNGPDTWPWIIDEINFDELLADVVEPGTEFIKDFAVSPGSSAAYIVTSILTMKVSEDIVSGDLEFNSADDVLNSDSVAYAPYLGSDAVCIDLGIDGDDEVVYVGTENGLYAGATSTDSAEFFDGNAAIVEGTAGYFIKMVSASPDGKTVAFAARRGDNPELLIIIDNDTGDLIDFRGLQGLPGTRLSNLAWIDNSILAVSGNRGLAVVDTDALFN